MPRYEKSVVFSNEGTRNEVRMRVIETLSQELPGEGNEEKATRYIYYVETLSSGDNLISKHAWQVHLIV